MAAGVEDVNEQITWFGILTTSDDRAGIKAVETTINKNGLCNAGRL